MKLGRLGRDHVAGLLPHREAPNVDTAALLGLEGIGRRMIAK